MATQVKCQNCGAVMTPGADGRTYTCAFCDAKLQAALSTDQVAAGLKLDLGNVEAFFFQLATSLHGSMGERTKLQLDGQRVLRFELLFEKDAFVVAREGGGVVTQHKKLVRGVALKTTPHPMDKWVALLVKALTTHANENARVAQVLAQLPGGNS